MPASVLLTLRAAGLSPSALRWDLQQRLAPCGFGALWGVFLVEPLPHSRNPDRIRLESKAAPPPHAPAPAVSPEMKAHDIGCQPSKQLIAETY